MARFDYVENVIVCGGHKEGARKRLRETTPSTKRWRTSIKTCDLDRSRRGIRNRIAAKLATTVTCCLVVFACFLSAAFPEAPVGGMDRGLLPGLSQQYYEKPQSGARNALMEQLRSELLLHFPKGSDPGGLAAYMKSIGARCTYKIGKSNRGDDAAFCIYDYIATSWQNANKVTNQIRQVMVVWSILTTIKAHKIAAYKIRVNEMPIPLP